MRKVIAQKILKSHPLQRHEIQNSRSKLFKVLAAKIGRGSARSKGVLFCMNTLERTAQKDPRELHDWLMRRLRFRLLAATVGFAMQAIQRDWIYPLQHHYS